MQRDRVYLLEGRKGGEEKGTVPFSGHAVTNQFNDNAAEQAQLNNVELVDRARLLELLSAHPVSLREIQLL